ncbi:MAG: glycosyltransferase family 4 protein [candidate division Zixibacteria bacterium]|nr:glycosyltransferase family 4 protein [candidate division Zixibacteria bacterium]
MKKYNLSHLEKVKIIYYGSPLEGKRIQNKTEEQNGKHILFVGNVKPHKNIRRLVAAYKILREKYGVSLPLLIAGEYKNFRTGIPGFEEEINKSTLRKSIKFTGKISDDELYELYREASVLVLPSLYEGFGLPPLEAMSFGCPVVVSKAASLPEVCGEAALYIDPLNIEDIADKINQVLTDGLLRKALINKGFARLKKYSWKKAADEYIQQFRSII